MIQVDDNLNIGRIGVEEYLKGRDTILPYKNGGIFKIIEIRCSFFNQPFITFDFGFPKESDDNKGGYFSLLLGKNGVCKSAFLREIIDFFIDAKKYTTHRSRTPVTISEISYVIDDDIFQVINLGNGFFFKKNSEDVTRDSVSFPLVIASTMSMFDRFPVNNSTKLKSERYDLNSYRYVGPKANNNLYTSKTNTLLQLMSSMSSLKSARQLELLEAILNFIGYAPVITITAEVNHHPKIKYDNSRSPLNGEPEILFSKLHHNDQLPFVLDFKTSSFQDLRSLPLASLNWLRQNRYLSKLKIEFQTRNNSRTVDASFLSSGEFNLLCIVMSVILAADTSHVLLLLDEPEISQHPNWQLDLIPNLDKALIDYGCHFIIATHCHFLVSNLPIKRSNVICISRDNDDVIRSTILPSETFGWSSEEVLLKAFNVPTDRNRYLAEQVGNFLKKIGNQTINRDELLSTVDFFRTVTTNLSIVDPMKRVLDTIIKEFNDEPDA